MSKLNKIIPVDRVMIILNTSESMGTAVNVSLHKDAARTDIYPIASGHSPRTLRTQSHEFGHGVGLHDGYERFYQKEEFGTSELFRRPNELKYPVLGALSHVDPIIGSTGNVCDGTPVYTFFPGSFNIMGPGRLTDDGAILSRLEQGLPVFNPLQEQIIRYTISKAIVNRRN